MSLFSTLKLIKDVSHSTSPRSRENAESNFLAASIKYLSPRPVTTQVHTFSIKVPDFQEDSPTKLYQFKDPNFS